MSFVKKYINSKYSFEGQRLDKFLANVLVDSSRSQIQKMIKSGQVLVCGAVKKSGYLMTKDDVIEVANNQIEERSISKDDAEDVPILYEDKDVLVVNKPYGMVVHPVDNAKFQGATLVDSILNKIKKNEFEGTRPGIVHRIDKDTSGLLVVARNKKSYENLVEQFKSRKVDKIYLALVCGVLKYPEGIVEAPIGRAIVDRKKMRVADESEGKMAVSVYRTLKTFKGIGGKYDCSLLEVKIKTGRTHQIRVHMSALGSPVIGDDTYGNNKVNSYFEEKFGLKRQFLHAHKLSFVSPSTKKEVSVMADLPSDLDDVIKQLS